MKEGWEKKRIAEICEKESSNIAQNKIENIDGQYPVYGASGFVKNIDFYHREKEYIGVVKDGSGVGRVNIYPAQSSLLGTMQYIIPKEGYSLRYVAYALKGLNLASFASGAAIPHIYFKDYGKCKIDVPPLTEQELIVSELDLLTSIINKQKAQLKELDSLAQSIFYDMFGDPIDNPKGWEVKKLGELCSLITKGTTPTTLGYPFVDEGVNFVKVESFVDGRIDSSKLSHITNECNMALSRSMLKNQDLLVCIAGATIGKMAVIDNSILPANTNQACAILRLKDKSNLRYIQSYLELKFDYDVIQMGKGVAQPNLSLGQLRNLLIPMPPIEQRESFTAKLEAIEAQKALITKSMEETQRLFDSRMNYWFA